MNLYLLLSPADNVFKQSGISSREVRLEGIAIYWICLYMNVFIFSSQFAFECSV